MDYGESAISKKIESDPKLDRGTEGLATEARRHGERPTHFGEWAILADVRMDRLRGAFAYFVFKF